MRGGQISFIERIGGHIMATLLMDWFAVAWYSFAWPRYEVVQEIAGSEFGFAY